ncbi:MAG: glycosyltransferase [Prevotella sp.]|nr:glycosyltransferase [Prevotella sp.]
MIPKTIHLCWFSDSPFPVEIKACIHSWQEKMPDYTIRRWSMADARALHCDYIDEALAHRKWAFAADAVRFHAVYSEGGIYMDSDILLYKNFEHLIPQEGFVTFNENLVNSNAPLSLQAAFFMAEKGNRYCGQLAEYYRNHHFVQPDGSLDETISPHIMGRIAARYGLQDVQEIQRLDGITVYPTAYVAPRKKYQRHEETFARHLVNHSWKKRKFGRKIEIFFKHNYHIVKYLLFKQY